jgi:hypothetical protein
MICLLARNSFENSGYKHDNTIHIEENDFSVMNRVESLKENCVTKIVLYFRHENCQLLTYKTHFTVKILKR